MPLPVRRSILVSTSTLALLLPVGVATAEVPSSSAPRTYANCTALNKVYPHGVGKPGARDRTSGEPITNFTRDKALYQANAGSDRDKDGIACEKA